MDERVLVIEDNRTENDRVCALLAAEGYTCDQAYDGAQGRERFDAFRPDAVLLDLHLPRVPALEVLRHIREQSPSTVVLILTGRGNEQSAVRALKIGAEDYLSKPVGKQSLVEGLGRHLRRAQLEGELEHRAQWPGEVVDHWLGRLFFEAPVPLAHIDPAGIIQGVNRAAARLVGRDPESLLGAPVADLVWEEIRQNWVEAMRAEAATPRGYEGEVLLRRGQSEWFHAAINAVEGPEPGHLLVALSDQTRQRAIEEQLLKTKRLSSLGHVVEGVAHEVRNPLISIGGFARKLRKGADENSREKQFLDVIVSEVERLERMVQDIEEYIHFAHKRTLNFEEVDLGQLVGASLEQVRTRVAVPQEVRIHINRPEEHDGAEAIFGDRDLLLELFAVLIENAFDAMPRGGELHIGVDRADGMARVRVADTGVGIMEADIEEVFDPFYTSKTRGAGLGLAKAYMIVEDHSGHIQFESQVGEGTVCTVSLPRERRQVARSRS